MRYVVVKNKDSSSSVHVWTKSQHAIPVKHGITRECSHRDYLRKNNIPFTDVSSIGMVYYNPKSGEMETTVLPWDTPAPEADSFLVQKEALSFYKKQPELSGEIQADWNEYKAWQKRVQELIATRK